MSFYFYVSFKKPETGKIEGKVFSHYNDMFPEIRAMVINEMEPEDRCRFTRCSKLSNKEAKSSKNYIHSLIFTTSGFFTEIWVLFNKFGEHSDHHRGYKLVFAECGTYDHYIQCASKSNVFWDETIDGSTDLLLYVADYFKQLLQQYQNKIKRLWFTGPAFMGKLKDYDFGIETLNSLQELKMDHDDIDYSHYLSRLRGPLKELECRQAKDRTLTDCKQIYRVTDLVDLRSIEFTYEQMLRLSASRVHIPLGDITEIEMCNFVRSWQNGILGIEKRHYVWDNYVDGKFDIPKLFQLLELSFVVDRWQIVIPLKNYKDARKKATLKTTTKYNRLSFQIE